MNNFTKVLRSQTISSRGLRWVDYWCKTIWWRREVKTKICWIYSPSSSWKHHRVVLVPRHVSTRQIRPRHFQERPLHRSLQESTRSIRNEKFTASSLSHLLARHDGRVSKIDQTTVTHEEHSRWHRRRSKRMFDHGIMTMMMDVYQKVTKRRFGYMVLDLHPASDGRKRVLSHLLMHEGHLRWHWRKKEDVWSLTRMVY